MSHLGAQRSNQQVERSPAAYPTDDVILRVDWFGCRAE
jgi:hypothetical protein